MEMKRSYYAYDHGKGWRSGFTLIEILVVMTIIGILMALVLGIAGPVQQQARVYRSKVEVAAIETALSRFETENGFVPLAVTIGGFGNGWYNSDMSSESATDTYRAASRAVFLAVTGRSWYQSTQVATMGVDYFPGLKENQVQVSPGKGSAPNESAANSATYTVAGLDASKGDYLRDPWGNPYGYYYDSRAAAGERSLYNQVTYDLWSTASEITNAPSISDAALKRWVTNYANQ